MRPTVAKKAKTAQALGLIAAAAENIKEYVNDVVEEVPAPA